MTSHLMYQKQDIKVRKTIINSQKYIVFKKNSFLSLLPFATAIFENTPPCWVSLIFLYTF